MEAVHVDRDARERPTAVEITFESGGKKHTVSFQNYRLKDVFSWYCDDEVSATVAVVFPSLTASIRYAGKNQVRGFIESLADGEVVLSRDLFPDSRAALGRMGISRILLRAELENTEALLWHAARPSVGIPASIITKCAAPEPKTAPSSAYGPFVSGKR